MLRPTADDDDSHKQGSKHFFFEKKKQKTFIPLHFASRRNLRRCQSGFTASGEKFFASFFQNDVLVSLLLWARVSAGCY
jgi:hypothetical protein